MVNFDFNLIDSGQQPNLFQLVIPVLVVNFHFHSPHSSFSNNTNEWAGELLTWTR
jgi:hypothetical protein